MLVESRTPGPAVSRLRLLVVACLSALVLFAVPLPVEAHGGGPESIISFSGLVNWLHLLGTVAWLGGVIFLRLFLGPALHILRPAQRGQIMTAVLQRYVHLAWWGVVTLFFSGILTSWAHVPTPETFTGTTYGLILTAKILVALGMVACTLIITLAARKPKRASDDEVKASPWQRWSRLATRVNLGLTILMLLSVAGLTEFERTPLSIFMNLVYYGGLTIWLGGLVFVPVVLSPSLQALEESLRARLAAAVLARYHRVSWPIALATIAASVLMVVRGIDSPSALWTEGFGVAGTLHVFSLVAVLIVMIAARVTPHDLLNRGRNALAAFTPALLIGALALLFFGLGGALEVPRSTSLAAEIPLAIKADAGPALSLMEPLGYIIAAFVTVAVIWHFAVVEGGEPQERERRLEHEARETGHEGAP